MTNRRIDPPPDRSVLDEGAIRRRSEHAGEPAWLLTMRLDGLDRFDPAVFDSSATDQGSLAPVASGPSGAEAVDLPAELADLGVLVEPLETAVREHPDLVRPHLGRVVPAGDGSDVALNTARWSGGTFIHVPAGVEVAIPIQATSRGRAATLGRFERTLLVASRASAVHVIEGCSAPIYTADPLRSSVTEVVVGAGARVTHTAIQNWSANVTNLAAKGAIVDADGQMEWIDGNMGSQRTSTLPTIHLRGPRASGIVRSVTMAEAGQHQQVGARMVHAAPGTISRVEAKMIADGGGSCSHVGQIEIMAAASGARSEVLCDALVLDDRARVDVSLDRRIEAGDAEVEEWSSSAGLDDDRLAYLASRGLSQANAGALLATGFIEPVTRRLPLEFAVEWNRLVELQRAGSVG